MTANAVWAPPATLPRIDLVETSTAVLGRPDATVSETEDVFRVEALGMEWDIGVRVFEPEHVAVGADGKKIGGFLLHGGQDDWRQMVPLAKLLAGRFGWKVVCGTFPGRLYLPDPSRNWPGDTLEADGTARTPIWQDGEFITKDQYDIIKDSTNRGRDGIRTLARARPGTRFYYRMAAWPAAMEAGMVEANRRHLPEQEYSVYVQGHSTGGPFVCMLSQRIPNCAGILAAENSPFGLVNGEKYAWSVVGKIAGYDTGSNEKIAQNVAARRPDRFNDLYLRTWRDVARYRGPEALASEGPAALLRLPWLMEDVFAEWGKESGSPRFKCEYTITHNIRSSLVEAAEVSAQRLGLDAARTAALVGHFVNFTEPLRGDVKLVPPVLFGISEKSRDHSPEVYEQVILPMFRKFDPAPKMALTHYLAGRHSMWYPEEDLPMGIAPAVADQWHRAIVGGWFTH